MITREQRFRLSVFLVVSTVLLTAVVALFVLPKLKDKGEVYYIDYKEMSVNGVNQGADVKYHGVRIGKVVSIDVNTDDLRSVTIGIRVEKGFPVKINMEAALQYAGITGLRFVEISGGTTDAPNLPPSGKIKTKKGLGEKAEDIVLNVDSVVEAVNDLLKVENREKIAVMLENLSKSTTVIANILQEREQNLGNSMKHIETITRQLETATANLTEFTKTMNEFSKKIPPDKITSIVNNTDTLITDASRRLSEKEMGKLLKDIDNFVTVTTISVRKIENRVYGLEKEMSQTLVGLREAMENISQFTRQLSEDPTMLIRRRPDKRRKK